ncbi:MAG TPA: phosphoenolpyruvate-utilizing N-terminal domain-containing protein, partial [Ottowia sp.]|nr:phosphoenolpyruvate-utilizing N-terminal domain-containing protein [Ottowia sp.]
MTIAIHGLPVARGIAIGRAVMVASSRVEVVHDFIEPDQVEAEVARLRTARGAVVAELQRMQRELPKDVPAELTALLDVHLMLLQDELITAGVRQWITERHYNAEWALVSQLEVLTRQFDEMEDEYLRERKADLEQVVERVLRRLKGLAPPVPLAAPRAVRAEGEVLVLVLVAHELSPADMLQFKKSVFAGFVTDLGGKTSHTAIVARSMDIPAVVGARVASDLVRQDDLLIIDGDAGVILIDPSPIIREEYAYKQRQAELERGRLARLKHTPALTLDGERIELLANIEQPDDTPAALDAGAVGVGLFRSEFLFMGREGKLPDEEEQYQAYRRAVEGMHGMPVTIRTIDVGADKPLDDRRESAHLNPALGLRAIRWSLSEPA